MKLGEKTTREHGSTTLSGYVAPTCTKRGSIEYESTDGQVKWSQAIEALGHNFKNGKCTRCNAVLTTAADYFIDVSKTAWYYKAVAFVVEKGLFNGMSAIRFNPNGSVMAIEGITSPDGRVFGKMAHAERVGEGLYKNVEGNYFNRMFESAVRYFK